MADIFGTTAGETLNGTGDPDNIFARAGDDTVNAGNGNDYVEGEAGLDTIFGDAGDDIIRIIDTLDIVDGGAGSDTLIIDLSSSGAGAVIDLQAMWTGGAGDYGSGSATSIEQLGSITGSNQADTILIGIDYLGSATVNAGVGNDIINTGRGLTTLDAGSGNDSITFNGTGSVNGGTGSDSLVITWTGQASARAVNLTNVWTGGTGTITGGTVTAIETVTSITGSSLADTLIVGAGYAGSVSFSGGGGADIMIGGNGNDMFSNTTGNGDFASGLGGADTFRYFSASSTLVGGDGDDVYVFLAGGPTPSIVEAEGGGIDTLEQESEGVRVAPANVERIIASTTVSIFGSLIFIGNELDNELIGGPRVDQLFGREGDDVLNDGGFIDVFNAADTMLGGQGDDVYLISVNGASTIELANEGFDEVRMAFSIYALQANVEALTVTNPASPHLALVGNAGSNSITGGTATDDLFGREGDDFLSGGTGAANTMLGQEGNDFYQVGAVGDSIIEFLGDGVDTVSTGLNSFTLPANVENLSFQGATAKTGVGNALANQLTGSTLNDFLSGLDGNDILIGQAGADDLFGGTGADQFRYLSPQPSYDRIHDFAPGTDKIALANSGFAHTATIAFVASGTPAATSSNSTFLYNVNSGILSYDADGSGSGTPTALAQLNVGLTLTLADFIFV